MKRAHGENRHVAKSKPSLDFKNEVIAQKRCLSKYLSKKMMILDNKLGNVSFLDCCRYFFSIVVDCGLTKHVTSC
jgi:hypothetical protein